MTCLQTPIGFDLKNVKNTHRRVLLLVKLHAQLNSEQNSSIAVFQVFKIVPNLLLRSVSHTFQRFLLFSETIFTSRFKLLNLA